MDINKPVRAVDRFQQKRGWLAFPFAVFKKYGEDRGGYLAALLTYYGFLSLFPLLLVMVTVLQVWFKNNPELQQQVSTSISHFFPLLGSQLQKNIHSLRSAGIGLIIGILVAIYGARGGADALRYALDNMWQVPNNKRVGFPLNLLHSLAIIAAAATGFVATVAVSVFTTDLGHAAWAKILANVLGAVILALVISYAFRISINKRQPLRAVLPGASLAAVIIQLLLTFGGILLARQLKDLSPVYGTFAVVLGMFFWIYLMSQVVLLCAEMDTVRHARLWPRSITGGKLKTKADNVQLSAK